MVTYLIVDVLLMIPLWRMMKRAGKPGALSLLTFAPGGFLICLGLLAFTKWTTEEA